MRRKQILPGASVQPAADPLSSTTVQQSPAAAMVLARSALLGEQASDCGLRSALQPPIELSICSSLWEQGSVQVQERRVGSAEVASCPPILLCCLPDVQLRLGPARLPDRPPKLAVQA